MKVFFSKREKETKKQIQLIERQEVICRVFGTTRPETEREIELSQVSAVPENLKDSIFWGGQNCFWWFLILFLTRIVFFVCAAERLVYWESWLRLPAPDSTLLPMPDKWSPFLKRNMKDFLCEVWDKFFMSKNFLLFHDLDFFFCTLEAVAAGLRKLSLVYNFGSLMKKIEQKCSKWKTCLKLKVLWAWLKLDSPSNKSERHESRLKDQWK